MRAINGVCQPVYTLYLYKNPTYSTIYDIMGLYKNYPQKSYTAIQEKFKKTMAKPQIEIEQGFAIHQNL